MKFQYALSVAWVIGILFAPTNLIVLGNSAGNLGFGFIFLLFLAGSAYIIHSNCYTDIAAFRPGAAGEFDRIANALGPTAAVIFSIVPRTLLAVFLSTATLVASGFVFNEVFVHRFPNFAVAFLMLGTLLAINLISRRLSGKIQIFLSAITAAGLSVLSIAGIYEGLKTYEIVDTAAFISPLKGSFSVLLLLPGAQQTPKASMRLLRWQQASNGAILMLMLTGSAILIATDDNIGLIVRYLIFIFICVGLPAWLGSRVLCACRRSYVLNGK